MITGFRRTVTASPLPAALNPHAASSRSPVIAYTPDGARISGRIVAAQTAECVLVVAGNQPAPTPTPTTCWNRSHSDSAELWRFPCTHGPPLGVRFANVPGGDNPAEGHITQGEVGPEVVAACQGQLVQINPATGPR